MRKRDTDIPDREAFKKLHWYEILKAGDRRFAERYLGVPKGAKKRDIVWAFIRGAFSSVSDMAVIPMQDILCLGGKARMNYPSTLGNNWQWRMKEGAFTSSLVKWLLDMTALYGRLSDAKKKEHN